MDELNYTENKLQQESGHTVYWIRIEMVEQQKCIFATHIYFVVKMAKMAKMNMLNKKNANIISVFLLYEIFLYSWLFDFR